METPAKVIPPPHNFPILLTEDEIRFPLTLFRNYFSGNTLPETRKALQELQDNALNNQLANGKDTMALVNDMLRLAEAGWLLCQLPPQEADEDPEDDQHFTKSKSLRDLVPQDPIGVTQEVFKALFPEDLRKDLWTWLQMVLSSDAGCYEECSYRATAIEFYNALLPFVDAMAAISKDQQPTGDPLQEQEKPESVIRSFCKTFSPHFVKIELRDWLAAAASTTGPIPEGMTREHLFELYEFTNCLIDAARILHDQEAGRQII